MLEFLAPWAVVCIVAFMGYNCYKQVRNRIKAENERANKPNAHDKRPRQRDSK
jgi:hypothetical protein